MPALAHIGVGLAAKKILPTVNVVLLIVAAEFIEIVFMVLAGFGIEHAPTEMIQPYSPYSHSILMGIVWTLAAGFVTYIFTKNKRMSFIICALVLSHFLLDIIASPKTAFYAADTGMPWFNNYSKTFGLGLWTNGIVAWIGELGLLVGGIVIYVNTKRRIRAEKVI